MAARRIEGCYAATTRRCAKGPTVASHIPGTNAELETLPRIWRRSSPDVQKTRRRDACRPEPSALFGVGALLRTQSVSKRRRRIFGALAAVAVILIGVLILFDWNWLKSPIESQVSERLGRPFRIHGDLDVNLSLRPRITDRGRRARQRALGQRCAHGEDRPRRGHGRSPQAGPRRDRAAGTPARAAGSIARDAARRAAQLAVR